MAYQKTIRILFILINFQNQTWRCKSAVGWFAWDDVLRPVTSCWCVEQTSQRLSVDGWVETRLKKYNNLSCFVWVLNKMQNLLSFQVILIFWSCKIFGPSTVLNMLSQVWTSLNCRWSGLSITEHDLTSFNKFLASLNKIGQVLISFNKF